LNGIFTRSVFLWKTGLGELGDQIGGRLRKFKREERGAEELKQHGEQEDKRTVKRGETEDKSAEICLTGVSIIHSQQVLERKERAAKEKSTDEKKNSMLTEPSQDERKGSRGRAEDSHHHFRHCKGHNGREEDRKQFRAQ